MAEYRRAEITSGLFIVLSVLLFAFFSFKVGGLSFDGLFGASGASFYTYFDEVRTLDVKSKVSVGGAAVGRVVSKTTEARVLTESDVKRLADTGLDVVALGIKAGMVRHQVRVGFVIDDRTQRLGDDPYVKIEQEGFIGPFFLALYPGVWDPSRTPPLAVEAPVRTEPIRSEPGSGLLDDFRIKFAPTLREIDGILSKINRDFLNEAALDDLRQVIPLMRSDLEEAQSLLRNMKQMVDPADADSLQATVLKPAGRLLGRLDVSAGRLDDLLKDAMPEIRRLLTNAADAAEEGERTIAALRRVVEDGEPKFRAMLNDVEALTSALASKRKALTEMVNDAQRLLTSASAAADGAAGLMKDNRANLAELIRTFRSTAWEAELLARKLRANPAVLIWGDDEPRLEAEPRDETGIRRSGRAKPYDQRDEGESKGSEKPAPPRKTEGSK